MIAALKSTNYGPYIEKTAETGQNTGANSSSTGMVKTALGNCFNRQFLDLKHTTSGLILEFMRYLQYPYMINNALLMLNSVANKFDAPNFIEALAEKIHPVGKFAELEALKLATTVAELYNVYLQNTPILLFFTDVLDIESITSDNMEIVRNLVEARYLESFYAFADQNQSILGPNLKQLIKFEIDTRILLILKNTADLGLDPKLRLKLLPHKGNCASVPVPLLRKFASLTESAEIINELSRNQVFLWFFSTAAGFATFTLNKVSPRAGKN